MAKIRASELVYSDIGQWEYDRDNESFVNTQSGFFVSRSEVKKAIGETQYTLSPKDMVHVLEALEEAHNAKKEIRAAIAIDFDGVIHSYEHGWKDGSIYGTPMKGSAEALQHLLDGFFVFILTSRDPVQVKEWMKAHYNLPVVLISDKETFWDTKGVIGITNRKLPAIAYVDDRAVPFHNWEEMNNAFKS